MSDDTFQAHRPALFAIAYRMLGSRADAEDVIQEAHLRYHHASSDELAALDYTNYNTSNILH